LQALAEAVTAQMTSLGNGVILETFTGVITVDDYDRGYGAAAFRIPWTKLGQVLGSVVSFGSFADPAGLGEPGWVQAPSAAHNGTDHFMIHAQAHISPYGKTFKGKRMSYCALGWGYPR
jgi:hypothetical protein